MNDIYFDPNYGKLYEKAENGTAEIFEMETVNGKITNQFIKRKIPITVDSTTYYDIVTPYGYGGPIIAQATNMNALLREYEQRFMEYCKTNHIVAEFVRFHPIAKNAQDFTSIYEVILNRQTVGTNLKDYDDPFQAEFSKKCRQHVRKGLKLGITYKISEAPYNLETFKQCYYAAMDRNGASDYYYFDNDYFNDILKYFRQNIVLVEAEYEEKVIAAGIYFAYGKTIHVHLSGTPKEYINLSPAYLLRYGITMWGKEHGYDVIHHGGGRSSSEDDNLYVFKKQFGKNTSFDFYIGKKIWDPEMYEKICEKAGAAKDTTYFPAYREPRI